MLTHINIASPLKNLELLLHKLLTASGLISFIPPRREQSQFLLPPLLTPLEILLNLAQNLLLLILMCSHDPLHAVALWLPVQVQLFLVEDEFVVAFLSRFRQSLLFFEPRVLDSLLSLLFAMDVRAASIFFNTWLSRFSSSWISMAVLDLNLPV